MSFPTDPEEFKMDERISYSKTARTFVLVDEEGDEWEWLADRAKWNQTVDEALMKQQAEIYKMPGVDENEPAFNPAKKRKESQLEDPETNPKNATAKAVATAQATAKPTAKAKATTQPRQNTAVFITGLPLDVHPDEVKDQFKRYGVIAESIDDDERRIKLYNDKDGNFKGEALVVFHRPESVQLAVTMADGAYFPRDGGLPTSMISVTAADSMYKAHKDDTVAEDRPKAKVKGSSRAKAMKKAEEMNSRLADWSSDDEPSKLKQTSSRWDKVVVVKKAFTPEDVKMGWLEEREEFMREEAANFGEVKNLTSFDEEAEGIVTIRFSNAQAARACAAFFGSQSLEGRRLETSIATGKERFTKSRKVQSTGEDEAKRLEDYSNFIEGKETASDKS